MDRKPITKEGYQKLKDEVEHLTKVDRPKIIEDISTARAHGDLKENAEYHAAKEQQGWIEGRIQQVNFILANSDVIDTSTIESDSIRFGATVTYQDMDTEEEFTWMIVGEDETDIKNNKISIKSPIAKALVGKEEGDDVEIQTPKGRIEVEIISVDYI
jgi:transcription elongation factor GreA